jgi:hypothetical protein
MTNDVEFETVAPVESTKEAIKEVFDLDMDVSGGWGYDNNSAIIINELNIPLGQFVYTFASIRANIEMSLLLEEGERYSGINVHLKDSKKFEIESSMYDVLTFEVTGMKEDKYAEFIAEYKEKYGDKEFDMDGHFERRKEATISRVVDYWFLDLDKV